MAELRKLKTSDLIARYDASAQSTVVGVDFYRDEIVRRESRRREYWMLGLTIVITLLTVVNVIAILTTL